MITSVAPSSSASGDFDRSLLGVRGNSRIRPQRFAMVICRRSYYNNLDELNADWKEGQPFFSDTWIDDLNRWNAYIAQEGLPRWGACLVACDPDDEEPPPSILGAIPDGYATPDGVTLNNVSYPPSGNDLISAFQNSFITTVRKKPIFVHLLVTLNSAEIPNQLQGLKDYFESEQIPYDDYSLWNSGQFEFPVEDGWLRFLPNSIYHTLYSGIVPQL